MKEFYIRVIVYLMCFLISLFGLNAFDFNMFIKKGKTFEAWVLYFVISMCMAYLLGQFMMAIIYYFN